MFAGLAVKVIIVALKKGASDVQFLMHTQSRSPSRDHLMGASKTPLSRQSQLLIERRQ
jgi:hypothetical protein